MLAAALRHAVDIATWRSLTAGNEIGRTEAVERVTALVEAAAAGSVARPLKATQ